MTLSLRIKNNLLEKEYQEYLTNVEKIITTYVSNTFSYYIKSDCLNKFNNLMCNKFYKSFCEFNKKIDKEKEEFEIELKSIYDLIESYIVKLEKLKRKENKATNKINLDIIKGMINQAESEMNEVKKEMHTKITEHEVFLTKFNDPEQRQFSNEYMRYMICNFNQTQYLKSFEITELLTNSNTELNLTHFYNSIEIYLALHKRKIEYIQNGYDILGR
jgi:hypothetical protein